MSEPLEHWYNLYPKLTELLLRFYKNHQEDSGILLYRNLFDDKDCRAANEWLVENGRAIGSVDPIQIFASINTSSLRPSLRRKRLEVYLHILGHKGKPRYEEIDFLGCPTPVGVNILSFRDIRTQREIWQTFFELGNKGNGALTDKIFDKHQSWFGIGTASFTIFLFWIRPTWYLPLDKNTTTFLESNKIINDFSFGSYKALLKYSDSKVYRLIATAAVSKSGKIPNREDEKELKKYFLLDDQQTIAKVGDFKLLGIVPLKGCNPEYLKILKENTYYSFSDAYERQDKEDTLRYYPEKDISLSTASEHNLNVSALVGKNGTGKSTILELLIVIFNNIAWKKDLLQKLKDLEKEVASYVGGIKADLFVKLNSVVRIRVFGNKITVATYTQEGNIFKKAVEKSIIDTELNDLFYSIVLNYSQHALNEIHIGKWLRAIFHKNDGYQIPVVLDPYRTEGNIDVNKQEYLAKARLVANLIEYADDQQATEVRRVTDYLEATALQLKLDMSKIEPVYRNGKITKIIDQITRSKKTLTIFIKEFALPEMLTQSIGKKTIKGYALTYILRKLYSIAYRYPQYKRFLRGSEFVSENVYFKRLNADKSHITFKLRQTINYLQLGHIPHLSSFTIDVKTLSQAIQKKKDLDKTLRTIELIPPPFFSTEIILHPYGTLGAKNGIAFSKLSSGEKQQIFSINAIIYHLRNLDSIHVNRLTDAKKYKFVNIIMDEIELYFHPEFQRTFLQRLISAINRIQIDHINSINLLFITHSPFILSDIPKNSVLFLEKIGTDKSTPTIQKPNSFGANIHELLANGFFMHDSIGEFARGQISNIIEFSEKVLKEEKSEEVLRDEYNQKKDQFYFIKENIGEDYIRLIIENHLTNIEKKLEPNVHIKRKIERLENQISELKKLSHAES